MPSSRNERSPSPRLAVLLNPHAQGGKMQNVAESLARSLPASASCHAPSTLVALRQATREIRDAGTEIVAIGGGDGTLHATITALHDAYGSAPLPIVSLLRGGTMNTIANALGVPRRDVRTLVARTLALDVASRVVERPTIACDGRLGFLFGVGIVPVFLEAYYESGSPSPTTAARLLARAIAESRSDGPLWRAFTHKLEVALSFDEGETLPRTRVLAVAAGTIDQIGLGFRPFRRAFETTDAMHLVRIDTDATGFVRELPRVRLGQPMSARAGLDRLTRGFTLSTSGPTLRYMLDGDVYHHTSGTLRVERGPLVRFATLDT